jgi:alpha-methylacyl-CoA racemase
MLEGIRVLDFASVGPAARASRWLADYGAEVVKIGPVPNQGGVQIVPPHYAYSGHRDMRRVLLDLKSDGGRGAFLELSRTADVVIESFRPGVVKRLGIDYDAVRAMRDDIVYCSTSGYGQTGPRSGWAGHDLNYLAVGGYLDCSGRDGDGAPPLPGATIADSAGGGMQAVMAIMAALVRRSTTGEGAYLDVSIADGVLAFMSLYIDEYLATGEVPGPRHNILTGRYACYDIYGTADDQWVSVAAIEPRFYANLCRALDCEQWLDHQTDDAVQKEVRSDFAAAFKGRDRDTWTEQLSPADCCVAPVLTVPELVDDAQFLARGVIGEATHPDHGEFRQVERVLAGQDRQSGTHEVPDWSVSQTHQILADAGMDPTRIAALADEGEIA